MKHVVYEINNIYFYNFYKKYLFYIFIIIFYYIVMMIFFYNSWERHVLFHRVIVYEIKNIVLL